MIPFFKKINTLTSIVFFLISFLSLAQNNFEKGYFINNDNNRIDCLIKNMDWKNNTTSFEYMLSENSAVQTITINGILEFGIDNISKYYRREVNIDRSSERIANIGYDKNPKFNKEQLLLKVLVEGDASLYAYVDGEITRYFYSTSTSQIEQLVFKSYKREDGKIAKNNRYKQQLLNSLKCPTIQSKRIAAIDYKRKSLTKLFLEYNSCTNSEVVNYHGDQNKSLFHINIRPRVTSSSLDILDNSANTLSAEFGNEIEFGIGLELEYIMHFNNNKWAVFVEPTLQGYSSETSTNVLNVTGGVLVSSVDYSSIEIPFGLRHYLFLNDDSKLFVDIAYVIDMNSDSNIYYSRADNSPFETLELGSSNNIALGFGYKLKDKYSLQLKYFSSREILENQSYLNADYKSLSFVFGYTLF